MSTITVTVPATSANLGPGFDCLGMALNLRNEFRFSPRLEGISIDVNGEGSGSIPTDKSNLIVQSMQFLCDYVGRPLPGCHIEQINHVPAASGLGSSSTATVAGLMGANALLGSPVDRDCILKLATRIEGVEGWSYRRAMEAVAASGAKPGDIAKSMHKLIGDSGKLLCNTYNLIIRSINTDLNTCSTVP